MSPTITNSVTDLTSTMMTATMTPSNLHILQPQPSVIGGPPSLGAPAVTIATNQQILDGLQQVAAAPSSSERLFIRWKGFKANIVSTLENIANGGQNGNLPPGADDTDIVLAGGDDGSRVRAHRLVLASASDYFKKLLLDSACPCCSDNESPMFILDGVDGDTLEDLISYLYRGFVNVNVQRLNALVKAGKTMGIKGILELDLLKTNSISRPTSLNTPPAAATASTMLGLTHWPVFTPNSSAEAAMLALQPHSQPPQPPTVLSQPQPPAPPPSVQASTGLSLLANAALDSRQPPLDSTYSAPTPTQQLQGRRPSVSSINSNGSNGSSRKRSRKNNSNTTYTLLNSTNGSQNSNVSSSANDENSPLNANGRSPAPDMSAINLSTRPSSCGQPFGDLTRLSFGAGGGQPLPAAAVSLPLNPNPMTSVLNIPNPAALRLKRSTASSRTSPPPPPVTSTPLSSSTSLIDPGDERDESPILAIDMSAGGAANRGGGGIGRSISSTSSNGSSSAGLPTSPSSSPSSTNLSMLSKTMIQSLQASSSAAVPFATGSPPGNGTPVPPLILPTSPVSEQGLNLTSGAILPGLPPISREGNSGGSGRHSSSTGSGGGDGKKWKSRQPKLCVHCDRYFSNQFNLKQHVLNMHTVGGDVRCDKCNKTVKNKWYLRRHHVTHHNAPLKK